MVTPKTIRISAASSEPTTSKKVVLSPTGCPPTPKDHSPPSSQYTATMPLSAPATAASLPVPAALVNSVAFGTRSLPRSRIRARRA
jgi:hypothetical protein